MADEQEWVNELSVGNPMLDQLIRGNGERIQSLNVRFGAGPDMARLMVQHLINTIYPERAERQAYELDFQQYLATKLTAMATQLEQIMEAQRKAEEEAAGLIKPPQGLIVPGQ